MNSEKLNSSRDTAATPTPQTEAEHLARQSRLARAAVGRTNSDPLDWMRKHPCITVGAAFAAGFVLYKVMAPTRARSEQGPESPPQTNGNTPANSNWIQSLLSTVLLQAVEVWLKKGTRETSLKESDVGNIDPISQIPQETREL